MGTFSVLSHIYYFLLYMKHHKKAPPRSRHHAKEWKVITLCSFEWKLEVWRCLR